MPYASDKRRALTAIFIVFLFIFSEILVAENEFNQLTDDNTTDYAIYQYSSLAEIHIDSANPDTNFNSATEVYIGENTTNLGEARALYRFGNNLSNSAHTIASAELTLTCDILSEDVAGSIPILYPATIIANFAPSEVTWNEIADSISWQVPGVDGINDRTVWDLPSSASQLVGSTYQYSINVTKLAQNSLESGWNKFDFVLTSVGGELRCFKDGSGIGGYDPELTVNNQLGVHGDGGSVSVPFLQNGLPLMTDDFIPQPDTHPTIIYDSLIGNDVEFQFSLVEDYRAAEDNYWIYSTMTNSFAVNGASTEYDIPSSQSFPVGDIVHYRYRTIDSTGKISSWTSGNFLLPGYSVTNNNDGTATLNISNYDFDLTGYKLIESTYVTSSNPNQQGSSGILLVENDPSYQSVSHLGVNLHLLGLPSNLTILDASIELTRLGATNSPTMLSMHEYTGTNWLEDEATWNYGSIGNTWSNGGVDMIGSADDTGISSLQVSDTFGINIHDSVQQVIAEGRSSRVNYLLTGMLPDEQAPAQTEGIIFHDDAGTDIASWPSLNLTYSFPINSSTVETKLIEPINGQTTWNVTGSNLSGNTTPIMTWETSDSSQMHSIIQVSTDEYFRNIILEDDSRAANRMPSNNDSLAVQGTNSLAAGNMYFWRVKHIDNDGKIGAWNESSFFITSVNSQWLGGDLYKLIINNSVDSGFDNIPNFPFSTISSNSPNANSYGYPYLSVAQSSTGISKTLLGFDSINYLLPDGLAVVESQITLSNLQVTGNPEIGVWELIQPNWDQQEVTWLESSDGVQWSGPGATGPSDRGNLLDSQMISSGAKTTWNITRAMQESMRDNQSLNLLLDVLPGQSNSNALFFSPLTGNIDNLPTVEIIYSPGSNMKPIPPSASKPTNGEWLFVNNSSMEVDDQPLIEWAPNNAVSVLGWSLEIDSTDEFNSPNKISASSWEDPGFDLINNQYLLQSQLQIGQQWFWRVRALSSTYQLGDWSSDFHFYLPDFDVNFVDADSYTTEYYHNSPLDNSDYIRFIDTGISESAIQQPLNLDEPFIEVGTDSLGFNSSMLIKIPIPIETHPDNASVVDALFSLETTALSTSGIPIAARGVLKPWNESLSNTMFDGINNWSAAGGRGIGTDISAPLDIQNSTIGEMSWDITPLVQSAFDSGQNYVSLMLYASQTQPGDLVYFQSSDFTSGQPTINLTWEYGYRELPTSTANLVSPVAGQIYFNQTSHAIIPDTRPIFEWQWPITAAQTPDAWIVSFDIDPSNDMGGKLEFDSRLEPQNFDLNSLQFMPDVDIDFRNDIYWSVRPISNSMYGNYSTQSVYYIPNAMGEELSTTDARLTIQDGTIYPPSAFPDATKDTYLDEGAPFSSQNGNGLIIGNSSLANSNLSSTSAVVSFNFSSLSMPANYEILGANLTLTAISGSGSVDISSSRLLTAWDETATWDNSSIGNQWNNSGALRGSDSDLPDSLVSVASLGQHTWNVTRIMQLSLASGSSEVSILLQPEIFNSPDQVVDGNYLFADSENDVLSIRPKIILEYRTTNQWLASSPSLTVPTNSETLWNTSSYELVGPDFVNFGFNSQETNITNWLICHGQQIRWLDCYSADDPNSDFSFDSSTNQFNLDYQSLSDNYYGDQWQYWRIRGDQNHRIGHYSPIYQYRMTDSQADSDGFGNYTVNLTRGSIFSETGELPRAIDASTNDVNQQDNYGLDSIVRLGYDPVSTGLSQAFFEYNLSNIHFGSLATPISAVFEVQLASNVQNLNPIDVSVYACDQFDELSITFVNSPSCSSTEITMTTISSYSGSSVQWDITTLLQNNFATGNNTVSFTLAPEATSTTYVDLYSFENDDLLSPKLILTYIENIGGLTPPSQTTLISPSNGEIIYDTTNVIVSSPQDIQLTWALSPDASDYVLFIKNQNNIISYDSRIDTSIQGNSFTSNQFLPGEVYEWWVQGVNQTIPGPSSQRWSFGVGDPVHSYNKDGTYSYEVKDSADVPGYSHANVLDNTITSALPLANFGLSDELVVGTGCFNVAGSTCDAIISLDTSQLPINSNQTIHSVELTLTVDQWDFSGGAYALDLSVHQFLLSNWNEIGITWNTTGATPGPVAGVDYVSAPLDQQTLSSGSEISFSVGIDSMVLGDNILLLIRGAPLGGSNFDGFVKIRSSEYSLEAARPMFDIVHTNVSQLNITTTSTTFDADNSYTFDVKGIDNNGVLVPGNMPFSATIEWFTTTGTIAAVNQTSAQLSPTTNGLNTISACYGVICTDYVIDIDSGVPVQLFASLSQTSDINSVTINADETVTAYAYAVDQHNNLVTTEVISFIPSNGTIDANGVFSPYASGQQTITAEWVGASSTLAEILNVTVLPGTPTEVVLNGCETMISANTSCDLFASAFDQFGNIVWFDDVIDYTLSATDGETNKIVTQTPHNLPPSTEVFVGEYTGNFVGQWTVTINTDLGISASITVNVTHGALASFTLESSASTITADDVLYINATRIDVRGNELSVALPNDNWTDVADGAIITGQPAIWVPSLQGSKTITASYQGLSDNVEVFVLRGVISDLQLIVGDEVSNGGVFTLTTDDSISAELKALDANGNQWLVDGNWTYYHPEFADPSILSDNFSQEITFTPTLASTAPYAITVVHTEGNVTKSANIVVYVSVGDIQNFEVIAIDSNGFSYTEGDMLSLTADDFIQFTVSTSDTDLNIVDDPQVTWLIKDKSTDISTDMTDYIQQNGYVWDAVNVGEYEITAYLVNNRNDTFIAKFDISVEHGVPISLSLQQSVSTQDAGNFVDLQVTGTDSDGNQFPQQVVWLENNGPAYNTNATNTEGLYQFNGRSAGSYNLTAEYLTLSSSVNVEVFSLSIVKNIKTNISTLELEQLESLTIQVEAYDEFWNKISIPDSARVDSTGRSDIRYLGNGVWELETLDEGEQSATIVIGSITETFTYSVEGNIAGFFAAGGPLYYVGASLLALICIALLIFVVRLVRGDEDYYDDEEDEDFYNEDATYEPVSKDFSQPRISQAPTVPDTPPQSPAADSVIETSDEVAEEDNSWMADYRVEDDGTEWGQTDEGVWYYREVNSDDWIEWND